MDIKLKCQCGSVRGTAKNVTPFGGNHLICMCRDCQAYAKYLGQENAVLDQHGGTEIFQLAPAQLAIEKGNEHIKCLRLSPKGLMRWYAGCCNTPIANTMATAKAPFAGVPMVFFVVNPKSPRFKQAFGPVLEKAFGRSARGVAPPDAKKTASLGIFVRIGLFMLRGWLKGNHKPSPFFDDAGRPIVEPIVLSLEQRQELTPALA